MEQHRDDMGGEGSSMSVVGDGMLKRSSKYSVIALSLISCCFSNYKTLAYDLWSQLEFLDDAVIRCNKSASFLLVDGQLQLQGSFID